MTTHNTATQRSLLIVNPNTTVAVTSRLLAMAQTIVPAGVHVHALTAAFGAPYISSEAAYAVAGHAVVDAWQQQAQAATPVHGVLIGCFGDPGLFALREMASVPVTGLAAAAFAQAHTLGPYAVVTGGQAWGPMLRRLALALPAGQHLLAVETVELDGAALSADPEAGEALLLAACHRVLAQHPAARSIIIGGAGLAGWAARMQPQVPVPLIDSVEAGVQELVRLSV